MNIGIYRNTFLPPSETFIYDQLINLENSKVKVITRELKYENYFDFRNLDIITLIEKEESPLIKKFKKLMFTLSTSSKKMEKSVKENDIELIHAHFGVDSIYALKLAKNNNIPLITTFHGYDITRLPKFTFFPISYMIYYFYINQLKLKGDLFIAVSNHIKTRLENAGFPKEKILIHHIGINVNEIPFKEERHNKEITFLAVGRLTEKKGTIYLIRAFEKLYYTQKNIKLIIIGDGPLKEDLVNFTDNLKSKAKIEFRGLLKHSDVIKEMLNADIFCFPSVTATDGDQEGLGMVQLEAAATGMPVIAFDSGGIKDGIIDGVTGFLIDEKDVNTFSEKMNILTTNKKLREEMGRKGRNNIEENFDIKKQTRILEKIYEENLKK
ncbi:glycosyltransferase [Planomicrobium sp. CPCC 101079]|uniref:glycosyltransferase n=1 Tax=Planomicrobium sp. CPCC 101079 TaxID=2599618 RepID=UPI0016446023|nr:glycosyltransferase [Planomicrobium sp. CPCC 101079]